MVSQVEDASSKQFKLPSSGMAGIYIYREAGWAGKTQVKQVYFDGQLLGGLTNGTYFTFEVAPGTHTLSAAATATPTDLQFTVKAGRNYFFNQALSGKVAVVGAVVSPFVSAVSYEMVDEQEGREGVLKCRQAVLQDTTMVGTAAGATTQPDCMSGLEADPDLKSISDKVALGGKEDNLASLMAIDERPSRSERKVVLKWAEKRERCFKANPPPQNAFYQLSVDSFNQGQQLIRELGAGNMTYGQFATRRKQVKEESLAKAQAIQAK